MSKTLRSPSFKRILRLWNKRTCLSSLLSLMPCRSRLISSNRLSIPNSNLGWLRLRWLSKRGEMPVQLHQPLNKLVHPSIWGTMNSNPCHNPLLSHLWLKDSAMKLTHNNSLGMKFKICILLHKITVAIAKLMIHKKKKQFIIPTTNKKEDNSNSWNQLPTHMNKGSLLTGMNYLRDLTPEPLRANTIAFIHQRTRKKKENRIKGHLLLATKQGLTISQLKKLINSNNRMRTTTYKLLLKIFTISQSSPHSHTKETLNIRIRLLSWRWIIPKHPLMMRIPLLGMPRHPYRLLSMRRRSISLTKPLIGISTRWDQKKPPNWQLLSIPSISNSNKQLVNSKSSHTNHWFHNNLLQLPQWQGLLQVPLPWAT
jgi:hypothetical protein